MGAVSSPHPYYYVPDPRVKTKYPAAPPEKLNQMPTAGLITEQGYRTKKTESLKEL
jgi:hypothetical protein